MKKMKFWSIMMLVAMVLPLMVACGGDDDDSPAGVGGLESLYGTWRYTSGYAVENGAKHHEKTINADDAGYLHFENHGSDICIVFGNKNGLYYGSNGDNFPFTYNQTDKTLKIGSYTYQVTVLTGDKLEMKYYYTGKDKQAEGDHECAVYTKVSKKVLEDKYGFK